MKNAVRRRKAEGMKGNAAHERVEYLREDMGEVITQPADKLVQKAPSFFGEFHHERTRAGLLGHRKYGLDAGLVQGLHEPHGRNCSPAAGILEVDEEDFHACCSPAACGLTAWPRFSV